VREAKPLLNSVRILNNPKIDTGKCPEKWVIYIMGTLKWDKFFPQFPHANCNSEAYYGYIAASNLLKIRIKY
jgi:hypothetical protein